MIEKTEDFDKFYLNRNHSFNVLEYVWTEAKKKIISQIDYLSKTNLGDNRARQIKKLCVDKFDDVIIKLLVKEKDHTTDDITVFRLNENEIYNYIIKNIDDILNSLFLVYLIDCDGYNPHSRNRDGVREPHTEDTLIGNLDRFNALNLALRNSKSKVTDKTNIDELIQEIVRNNEIYERRQLWDFEQVFFDMSKTLKHFLNISKHRQKRDKRVIEFNAGEKTKIDFITGVNIPFNSIILAEMICTIIYWIIEINQTWIITFKYLGII